MLMTTPVGIGTLPQQVPARNYFLQVSHIAIESLLGHSSVPLPAGVHQRCHPCPVQQLNRNPLHLQEVLQSFHVAIVHALEDRMVMIHNFGWLWRTVGLRDLNHPEALYLNLKAVRCQKKTRRVTGRDGTMVESSRTTARSRNSQKSILIIRLFRTDLISYWN